MRNATINSRRRRTNLAAAGLLLVLPGLAGRAGAQQAAPASSQGAAAQAKPTTKAGVPSTAKAGAAKPTRRPATKPRAAAKPKPPPSTTAVSKPPAPKKEPAIVARRDPFKLPPLPIPGGQGPEIIGPLPRGTRGLVISQLRLEGIVRLDTTNTMIAVVTSYTNLAYFLRENDALYNGVVSKITSDSVYFTENYLDPFGRVSTREVVKKLSSAPGEGR